MLAGSVEQEEVTAVSRRRDYLAAVALALQSRKASMAVAMVLMVAMTKAMTVTMRRLRADIIIHERKGQ